MYLTAWVFLLPTKRIKERRGYDPSGRFHLAICLVHLLAKLTDSAVSECFEYVAINCPYS